MVLASAALLGPGAASGAPRDRLSVATYSHQQLSEGWPGGHEQPLSSLLAEQTQLMAGSFCVL